VFVSFKIDQYDTGISWPDDPRKEPRDKELEMIRNIYQYGQTAPDLPVQVSYKQKNPLKSFLYFYIPLNYISSVALVFEIVFL